MGGSPPEGPVEAEPKRQTSLAMSPPEAALQPSVAGQERISLSRLTFSGMPLSTFNFGAAQVRAAHCIQA